MASDINLTAERILISDSLDEVNQLFYERGWGDGLPIVPPTPERVMAMVEAAGRDPAEEIASLAPRYAPATVESIAINAVMAGCLPAYVPVLIAAVGAIAEPQFNLYGIQATTGSPTIMLIINGPIARELDVNSGANCFGEGWRANATIGRAIRLIQRNIGGALPGSTCKATLGWPGKFTMCVAEAEESSPWEPLHVERGFHKEESTVTIISACSFLRLSDLASSDAEGVLTTLSRGIRFRCWAETVMVISPEHATIIARGGYSKAGVKRWLWEHSGHPISELSPAMMAECMRRRPDLYQDDSSLEHITDRPEDIIVMVAGGAVGHSAYIQNWGQNTVEGGSTRSVTRPIEQPARPAAAAGG